MSDAPDGTPGGAGWGVDPWETAAVAAARAGVQVRPLSGLADFTRAADVLDEVWCRRPEDPPELQPALMVALDHAGNYLVGAWAGEEMVGASVAFLGRRPDGWTLHSHITGVLPGRRGVGAALKWHQRAWALERSIGLVTWTFDPLIARNAFFNLERLGVEFEHYLVDFYGPMHDGRNRGQPTDRVAALWRLTGDRVSAAAAAVTALPPSAPATTAMTASVPATTATTATGPATTAATGSGPATADADPDALTALGASVLLRVAPGGGPEIGPAPGFGPALDRPQGATGHRLIGIPDDIERLRRRDPQAALAWRMALRRVLRPVVDSDRLAVEGFLRSGWYLVRSPGRGQHVPTPAPTWRAP